MSEFTNQTITFHSDALDANALIVKALTGHESISGLFRFELELLSMDKQLKLEDVIAAPATLGIKQTINIAGGGTGARKREFAGVLTELEQLEEGQGWVSYKAVLVPQVWQLTQFYRSRIFQAMSCPQIVKQLLEDLGLAPSVPKGDFGDFHFVPTIDEKMKAPSKDQAEYPQRTYVVQYEESDWDLLARWLEHEGIYFFFENKDQRERIVFGDSSTTSETVTRIPSEAAYPYRPQTGTGASGSSEELIVSFTCKQTRAPKEVALNDYNWRDAVRLTTKQAVDDNGVGLQTEYNDHYKNEDQGKALAKVRKEELLCMTKLFQGTSTCRAFRPGKTFTLEEHYRGDFNADYLLVGVTHNALQTVNLEASTVTGASYYNTFEAIPANVPFRPERVTDWPSIKGVMHAKVDSTEGTEYADLDEDGCYTVRIPYDPHFDDEKEREGGGASRRVRMAQPFSGMDAGFHFPLLRGTEVILTHIDGDPDRPIIAGAVPNAETGNVGGGDESRNRIVSNTGNRFEIHDTAGASGFFMADTTGSVVSDQRHRLGSGGGGGGGSPGGGGGGAARPKKRGPAKRARPKTREEVAAMQGRLAPTKDKGHLVPGPGAGMPMGGADDEEKVTGAHGGFEDGVEVNPSSALSAFVNGDAAGDIGSSRYVGSSGDGISSSDLNSILTLVTSKHTIVGTPGEATYQQTDLGDSFTEVGNALQQPAFERVEGSAPAGSGSDSGLLAAVNNFEGLAFGSRLRIWLGDTIQVNRGDKYTYADVTHDCSYGTGGYGFHQEDGDTNDEKFQYGDASSTSKTYGNSSDTSETHGDSTSMSTVFGNMNDTSFFWGTKVSFDFKGSLETSTSVALGGFNSNSLTIGAKGGLDIFIGGQVSIDITIAAYFKMNLELSGGLEVKVSVPSKLQVTLPHKAEIDVAKMKVALDETQAVLNKSVAAIAENNADIARTSAALKGTVAALKQDDAFLQANEAALNQASANLAKNDLLMAHTKSSLSELKTQASSTALSGAHIIS